MVPPVYFMKIGFRTKFMRICFKKSEKIKESVVYCEYLRYYCFVVRIKDDKTCDSSIL